MKIAVLIAGEYREFEKAHKFWSFLNWGAVDTYVATWSTSLRFSKYPMTPSVIEHVNEQQIKDLISVTAIEVAEKPSVYTNSSGCMLHRWHAAINLMVNSGISYDRVILIRPDIALDYDEHFFKSWFYDLPDDDTRINGIIGGQLDLDFPLSEIMQVSDLMYIGTQNSIIKLLKIPVEPFFDSGAILEFPESNIGLTIDIHRYLAHYFLKLYDKFRNIPIPRQCIVRSNCRELSNPTFQECKQKAREWWETKNKKFFSMTENVFSPSQATHPVKREINIQHHFNLWNKFDFKLWSEADRSMLWKSPDTEKIYDQNKLDHKKTAGFKTYDKTDITYCYNSYGFRKSSTGPAEFEDAYDYPTLLVSGCSNTEGIGLKENHIWHSFLEDKLASGVSDFPIAKFNLGKGGISAEAAIRYVYVAIEHKKCKPDLVYLLLPPPHRREFVIETPSNEFYLYNYMPKQPNQSFIEKPTAEFMNRHVSSAQLYHEYFRLLLFLKYYLESKNIIWYFSCWGDDLKHNIGIDYPRELEEHYIDEKLKHEIEIDSGTKRLFNQNIARDYAHYGPPSHYVFALGAFEKMKNKKSFSKVIDKWSKNGK